MFYLVHVGGEWHDLMDLFQPNHTIHIRQKKHTKRRNKTIFARLFVFLKITSK